jgi:hypothetical protein
VAQKAFGAIRTNVKFGFPDNWELTADSRRLGRIELIKKNGEQEQRGPIDAVPDAPYNAERPHPDHNACGSV